MAKFGPNTSEPMACNEPVVNTKSINNDEREQEISTLIEELAAQEALRGRERDQKKVADEDKWRMEETL